MGIAAETKKPTSVVLLLESEKEELAEKYEKLHEKIKKYNPYL